MLSSRSHTSDFVGQHHTGDDSSCHAACYDFGCIFDTCRIVRERGEIRKLVVSTHESKRGKDERSECPMDDCICCGEPWN